MGMQDSCLTLQIQIDFWDAFVFIQFTARLFESLLGLLIQMIHI